MVYLPQMAPIYVQRETCCAKRRAGDGPDLPHMLVLSNLLMTGRRCGPLSETAVKALPKMEGGVVLHDLIPNVRQLYIAYVPLKGWLIDPDVHGLLDAPGNVVYLPTHSGEIAHTNTMTRGVTMVIDGGGTLRCSLNLFPKVLTNSPMYSSSQPTWSHLNLQVPYYSEWSYLCLWGHKEAPNGVTSFKTYLDPNLTHTFLKLLLSPLVYGNNYVDVTVFVTIVVILVYAVVVLGQITTMSIVVVVGLKSV